jgi:all-trans-8'-apo-beta-carotenal 15,15'-oxygenase
LQGEIPKDLKGTLLRNGPGNFDFGSMRINHPFDGDGIISAYSFVDGQVLMRRKFVRTQDLKQEMEAGAVQDSSTGTGLQALALTLALLGMQMLERH